jgi:hypothetical protein
MLQVSNVFAFQSRIITDSGLGILRLLMLCGVLYICNIFAADTVYIAEAVKQPILPSFSVHFDSLRNRLTSSMS